MERNQDTNSPSILRAKLAMHDFCEGSGARIITINDAAFSDEALVVKRGGRNSAAGTQDEVLKSRA
jgi:hypothetical protein